jgi:formyl-CoA transferase
MQNVFPKLSETPGKVRRPAPDAIGQHSEEVLREVLEMDAAEIAGLHRDGVI